MGILWDFLAGLSVAGLLLPEAVAYSLIAGVPPAHAIVAALCGLFVFGLLGRSRFAIVAPTSSSAAILAASVGSLALAPEQRIAALSALVILCGVLFVGVAVAKLGNLSSFVSRAVLHGFAFGLALTIVIKQLPLLFGLEQVSGGPGTIVLKIVESFPQWNLTSLAVGISGLIGLVVLKRFRGVPAAFIILVLGIAASKYWNLGQYHVQLLGKITFGTIHPDLPLLSGTEWLRLLELAPPLFLIVFAESWGSIRNLALLHNDQVDANRELLALGAANITSGVFQGLAVGAGFSASSANEAAGAQSRLSGVITAVAVSALMMFAIPLLAHLPEPILAAVVISALLHALNPKPLLRLWSIDRDQYIAVVAAFAVLAFGVLIGMLSAIALSVLALVSRLSKPAVVQLGRLGDGHDFVDILRFPNAQIDPNILILRPAHPIFFANAEGICAAMLSTLTAAKARTLVVSLEESADLDSTALECLSEFNIRLQQSGCALYFARVREKISQALQAYDPISLGDPAHQGLSVADAYDLAKLKPRG